ncbi:MAG: ABC transporter permease, partial [Actinobacteria bacterium]|nr:ABC transporter permease [Actinomycetota bacterium]
MTATAQTAEAAPVSNATADEPPVHRIRKPLTDRLRKLWSVLVYVFLFIPILVIVIYSFNTGRLLIAFDHFGFDSYAALFQKHTLSDAVMISLIVGALSSVFAAALGTFAGIA